jgi:VIT1/CCC1 family predicted Fe2+/Mn2+ transporter
VALAASIGASVNMGLAEELSEDGEVCGRGKPISRGVVTGSATALGGMLHTLPFLIGNLDYALHMAYVLIAVELITIAIISYKCIKSPHWSTVFQVIIGAGIVFLLWIWLGELGVNE